MFCCLLKKPRISLFPKQSEEQLFKAGAGLGSMVERTGMSELEVLDVSPSHVIFCSGPNFSLPCQADIR